MSELSDLMDRYRDAYTALESAEYDAMKAREHHYNLQRALHKELMRIGLSIQEISA